MSQNNDDHSVDGLLRKRNELLGEVRKLKDRVKELEAPKEPTAWDQFWTDAHARVRGLEGDARAAELAKIQGEVETLTLAEVATHKRTFEDRVISMRGTYCDTLREIEARKFVLKIAREGTGELLMPYVLARLTVEQKGDEHVVSFRDAAGKPTSPDAYAEELRNDVALKPVVLGSTAEEKAAHARRVAETLGQAGGKVH